MDRIRVAVCDDEKEIREILSDRVLGCCPEAEILAYLSGDELLLSDAQPDILLLDIQMSGRDGMETAREYRKRNKDTILIFITAIEEYVFQAFDVGAFHYLVKPFSDARFEEVFQKAVIQRREAIDAAEKEDAYIMVKSGGSHIKVFLKDIVYAEVFNRKVMIHKTDEDIEYYGKMSELEAQAGEDFFRPHRAYLINFQYVERYDASTIYVGKNKVLMAKQNYPGFVKNYLKYNQRKAK